MREEEGERGKSEAGGSRHRVQLSPPVLLLLKKITLPIYARVNIVREFVGSSCVLS